MEEFLSCIASRKFALRTDVELRTEFDRIARGMPDARDYRARFDQAIEARGKARKLRNEDYQKVKPDAQKGRF